MSMTSLERAIMQELREVTGERNLRLKDLMEWSTGEITPQGHENVIDLPRNGVIVCYLSRRKSVIHEPHGGR